MSMSVMVKGMSLQKLVGLMQKAGVALEFDEIGSEYCAEDVYTGDNGLVVYGIYDEPEQDDDHYYENVVPF